MSDVFLGVCVGSIFQADIVACFVENVFLQLLPFLWLLVVSCAADAVVAYFLMECCPYFRILI